VLEKEKINFANQAALYKTKPLTGGRNFRKSQEMLNIVENTNSPSQIKMAQ
jgi:hypothetical protein|tara:strand:- start:291 stop:443 length:153 start_codon:yes stop_codon:yes gene_type:complete